MDKLPNSKLSSGAVPPKPIAPNLPPEISSPISKLTSLTSKSAEPKLEPVDEGSSSPIPSPNNSLQYRAIGVVEGLYASGSEHFCKGKITTTDGTEIEAVVLGKVMPILQKKLDLAQSYLWVVYPRIVNKTAQLYVQIVGVWAPEETGKTAMESNVEDGYFSIRGEVIEQSSARNYVIVKIKRKGKNLPKAQSKFKLKLKGILPSNAIGYFWDIKVQRQEHELVINYARAIALIPKAPPKKPLRKAISTESLDPNKSLVESKSLSVSPPVKRTKT